MNYLQIEHHWLKDAEQHRTDNYNDRPDGAPINLLVIHNISLPPGKFGGPEVIEFFTNKLDWTAHPYFKSIEGVKVSSHLFIRRDGKLIQFVPFNKRAWHAGRSTYCGEVECNDFSVGIEMEGMDNLPYTMEQYTSLSKVTQSLLEHYPELTKERITGHEHIAPGRKTDPGPAFDWNYYKTLLNG